MKGINAWRKDRDKERKEGWKMQIRRGRKKEATPIEPVAVLLKGTL